MTTARTDLTLEQPAALLRDRVLARLRWAIMAGHYAPGERLLERELCEALGVSRTSVREALRQLEIEQLVATGPRGRPFVAVVTAEAARSIYELREILECAAARLFCARASAAQVAALDTLAARFRQALESGDLEERLAVKAEFYELLFAGAGNPDMARVFVQLFNRIGFLRYRSLGQQARAERRASELDEIVARLVARDAEGAEAALRHHIRAVAAAAVDWLEAEAHG